MIKNVYKLLKLPLLVLVAGLFLALSASAQQATVAQRITGKVTDAQNEPLPGVAVTERGTKNTAVTDINGNFSIAVKSKQSMLEFSYLGFSTFVQAVGDNSSINVKLQENNEALDEVIVTGYTVEKKRDLTGAISSLKADQIDQTTPISALDAMQGRMAGVQISSNNGPGAGSDIKIRGISTFEGGAEPLYVVDGQQLDNIDNINPNDIESIEVLKDGASAAIYGSKSANGVIIITTKKGVVGATKIDANFVRTYSSIYRKIPVANTRQRFQSERLKAGNAAGGLSQDSLSLQSQIVVDIQDLILKTAVRDQYNLTFSGASDKNNFYANIGYLKEDGIVLNSSYDRVNANINLNFNVNKITTAGFRINSSYELQKGLNEGNVFTQLAQRPAYFPVRDYNGSFFPEVAGRQNPLAEALASTNNDRDFRSQIFNFVEISILKNLKFKSTLGANFSQNKINLFGPTATQTVGRDPDGSERQTLSYDIQHEDYFTYNQTFGKHNLSGLAGLQFQKWNTESSNINGTFSSDNIPTFNNVKVLDLGRLATRRNQHSMFSLFGKASYNYASKYLISATVRQDASSRFGSGNKNAIFPSVSAGWRISDENFMAPIVDIVSDLKFRVGYAITGNERIGDYDSLPLYSPGSFYNGVNGVSPTQLGNPNLSWESTKSINYGLDIALFKNRVNITADAYIKTTDDLLANFRLPEETGYSSVRTNIGSLENRGLEFLVSGSIIKNKSFEWFSSVNISFNANKVLSLAEPDGFETGIYKIEEGESIGNMYGFTQLGVFPFDQSNGFTPDGVQLTPQFSAPGVFSGYTLNDQPYTGAVRQLKVGGTILRGGDIFWKDLNNDFLIDAVNDRSVIGNGLPKSYGGLFNEFKYKGVGLSFLFDFNFGNDIYKKFDFDRNTSSATGPSPEPKAIDLGWRAQGDITDYPALQSSRAQNRVGANSFYVSEADFIKLRNIRLSYTLPKSLMEKVTWVRNVGFNFSINNPVTFTNYSGYNPELGSRGAFLQPGLDNLRYPNKTEFILGLRAQF